MDKTRREAIRYALRTATLVASVPIISVARAETGVTTGKKHVGTLRDGRRIEVQKKGDQVYAVIIGQDGRRYKAPTGQYHLRGAQGAIMVRNGIVTGSPGPAHQSGGVSTYTCCCCHTPEANARLRAYGFSTLGE